MPVIGSSSVTPAASIGPQGPIGITGIGFTGGLGPTGPTGPTGATGTYVESSYHIWPDLYLVLSDGTEVKVEGLAGPTGSGYSADGKNSGSGTGIFKLIDGNTFWFKGISGSGSILVYETDNTVGISGDKEYQKGSTADISERLRFAYLSDGATADVTGLTFDPGLTGTMIFGLGVTGNKWYYDPEEIVVSVSEIESTETVTIYGGICEGDCGQTAGRGVGIQLGVTAGTVFDVQTPIGIAGFTGDFGVEETHRFTMMLHGNDIWDWPKNVYFDENNIFFSCGTDIIGFSTSNGGETWYANISSLGYNVEECESVYGLGACCYTNDDGRAECQDFVSKQFCDLRYNSIWSPLSSCANNCGQDAEGICCSDGGDWNFGKKGICLEGIGAAECNYFNGQAWNYFYYELNETGQPVRVQPYPIECDAYFPNPDGGEPYITHSAICINPCDESVACCKQGSCIGDSVGNTGLGKVSSVACTYVYGGNPIPGECGEVDCCDSVNLFGACCSIEDQQCYDSSSKECSGVFMGPNTNCADVNCCFGTEEIGWCCKLETGCVPSFAVDCPPEDFHLTIEECEDYCDALNEGFCCVSGNCIESLEADCPPGLFHSTLGECTSECFPVEGLGACCLRDGENNLCYDVPPYTETYCESLGGVWTPDTSCSSIDCDFVLREGACCILLNSDEGVTYNLTCTDEVTYSECVENGEQFGNSDICFSPDETCDDINCRPSNVVVWGCSRCSDGESCGGGCCPDNPPSAFAYDPRYEETNCFDVENDPDYNTDYGWGSCVNPAGPSWCASWMSRGIGPSDPCQVAPECCNPECEFVQIWNETPERCIHEHSYCFGSEEECGGNQPPSYCGCSDSWTLYGGTCTCMTNGGAMWIISRHRCGYPWSFSEQPITGIMCDWCFIEPDINYGPVCSCDCAGETSGCDSSEACECGVYDPCANAECEVDCGEEGRRRNNERDDRGNIKVRLPDGRCIWMIASDSYGYPVCRD